MMRRYMKRPTVKAKAIDLKKEKEKIIIGGMALIAGLVALALFSLSAQAKDHDSWNSYSVGEGETIFPFHLRSQLLGH